MRLPAPASLRERLALAAVLVAAGAMAVLTVGFNVVLSQQLRADAGDLLRSRAQAAAAGLEVGAAGVSVRDPSEETRVAPGTWVFSGDSALVRPRAEPEEERRVAALVGRGTRTLDTAEPEAVRYYALPVPSAAAQVGTVVTSLSLDPYERARDLALLASGALALVVLVGAYGLSRTLIGRALAPVAEMTEQADRWSATDLDRRFGDGARPLELAALARTLDAVLDRLSAVLRHEQQLSAELSHELRTPLTAIVAEVELLGSRPRSAQELTEGHTAVLAAAERMRGVLESLLTAARASTSGAPGRCVVQEAVATAVRSVAPPDGAVRTTAPGRALAAGVDHALLERALAPVLDNALRYRRALVQVVVEQGPHGPRVSVQDDGPGVDPALAETLFEPGVREPSGEGSGLGLALARRLVRAGGGELSLVPSTSGARFEVVLPEA